MIVNLSVDTSSADMMELCKDLDAYYIDTVSEPWPGFYYNAKLRCRRALELCAARSVLDVRRRQARRHHRRSPAAAPIRAWCPGSSSRRCSTSPATPAQGQRAQDPRGLGPAVQRLGVKGIHIAERDTQRARSPKPRDVFVNTWSVEGFVSEGLQPAELGFGTHEKAMPPNGHRHDFGCDAAIYLAQPGAATKVRLMDPDREGPARLPGHPQRVDFDRRGTTSYAAVLSRASDSASVSKRSASSTRPVWTQAAAARRSASARSAGSVADRSHFSYLFFRQTIGSDSQVNASLTSVGNSWRSLLRGQLLDAFGSRLSALARTAGWLPG